MTTDALLAELCRRGVRLSVMGDRLRYAPRSAVEPDLLPALREHKAAIVGIFGDRDCAPERPQSGQSQPLANATPASGMAGRPILQACGSMPDTPHELSLAERVAAGYVNPGWRPADWAARLRQLADRCESPHSKLAAQYRTWASNIVAPIDK